MIRRPVVLLVLAACCAIATVLTWLIAVETPTGRKADAAVADAVLHAGGERLLEPLKGATSLADTLPFAVGAVCLVALAWLRRGAPLAIVCALTLIAANAMTQLLQPALAGSRQVDLSGTELSEVGSWPSGHAAAAMLLALCAVLVAGPRLRLVTAIGGLGYALLVGGALVVLGGHLPSDIVAGYLLAGAFTALAAAAVARLPMHAPGERRPAVAPALGALAAVAVFATAAGEVVVTRRDELSNAIANVPLLLAGAALAAAVVVLGAGVALVRR